MTPLRVDNLTKRFHADQPPAVDAIGFQVLPNEVFTLVGPSGCGKTTTLRMIAGFERPDAGTIFIGDEPIEGPGIHVPPEKRQIGLVFQDYALFPHLDVLHNVMFGLNRLPKAERKSRAMQCLEIVGLMGFALRKPHELSGGQQQRVALARSIATRPRIILLDEPFSNLDPALRAETRSQIRDLLHRHGMSALLVTHDQEEALSFADRIGVMHQGRIVQVGKPQEVYTRPRGAFVAQFLGRTNLIDAQADGQHAATALGRVCLCCPATGHVTLSVRPEHLKLTVPQLHQPVGRVISREFKGHDLTLVVRCDDQEYLVQTDYNCPFQVGQIVGIAHMEPAVIVDGPRPC